MKKLFKILAAATLLTVMFGCEFTVVETTRDLTFYNGTGNTIDFLYAIPASEYYNNSYHYYYGGQNSYYYGHKAWLQANYTDELGTGYLYSGYYQTITLDSNTAYYIIGLDDSLTRVYSEYVYASDTYGSIYSSDYEYQ